MEAHLVAILGQGIWGIAVIAAMGLLMVLMALLSIHLKVLTPTASLVAAIAGLALLLVGGPPYLAIILFFVVTSAVATRYRIEEKRRNKVSEGREGERGISNVLAHAIVPLTLVLPLAFLPSDPANWIIPFLYTSAIAFGAADTFASEIGVLAGKAVSILDLKDVPPGTNGGVSLQGELAALFATLITALFGAAAFVFSGYPLEMSLGVWVGGVTVLGWVGCQLDSLAGVTLENRGILGKSSVNLMAMAGTALLAALVLEALLHGNVIG